MPKRIFCFFLAVIIMIGMLPNPLLQVNAAGPGPVTYKRQKLDYPVMTYNMSQNSDFLSHPDSKISYSNYGWLFKNGSSKGLWAGTYTRYTDTHTYSFDNGLNVIKDIKNRGQLWVGYTLSMCPSRHTKFGSHLFTEKLCYEYTALYDNYWNFYFRYSGGDNDQNVLRNYGSSTNFNKVDAYASKLEIAFGLGGSCTAHGDAYIKDAAVYFADRQAPKINQVLVTEDEAGKKPKQYFKANEPVYIHLVYDEPIRFSDNSANHDNVTLALKVFRKASASDYGVGDQYAKLIALDNDRLTFQYVVPDIIQNTATNASEATDHYIGGIRGSSAQNSLYGSSTAFDLKYCYGSSDYTYLLPQYRNNMDFVKTGCLITDLAGNPAQTFADKALNSHAYLDNVPPKISYVDVIGSMIDKNYTGELDAPDLDRSTVFAGVGDTLNFTAWFSEYMRIDSKDYDNIQANINVRDAVGNPVKLKAVGSGNAKRNVEDKFDSAYITFATMTVEAGMTPIEYDGVEDKRISIASIDLLGGLRLLDPSNNAYDPVGINIIKDLNITAGKTEFLDTLAPIVYTSANSSGMKYFPVFYPGSDSAQFCFPISASDDTSEGTAYVSRVSTKDNSGSFEWISASPFTFKYKVTGSNTRPEGPINSWSTGTANTKYSFTQITQGNFIHIALMDTENYSITDTAIKVYAVDFAGNQGSASFALDYIYDTKGPVITPVRYETGAGSEADSGYIDAVIKLEDPSKVDISSVKYRWYDNSTKAYKTDWINYSGSVSQSAVSMELEFSLAGLQKGVKHDYNLLIQANDHSTVVAGGNQTIMDPGFNYLMDLAFPAYNFSYSTGYEAEPKLIIKDLQERPGTNEDSTVIVMIKDPMGETGNEYFVRTITTGSENNNFLNHTDNGDVLDHFKFDSVDMHMKRELFSNEPLLWRYQTVTTEASKQYIFNDDAPSMYNLMTGFKEEKLTARRLQAMMDGKYYGDIEATVIAGYGQLGLSYPGREATVAEAVYALNEAYPGNTKIESYSADGPNFKGLDCYCVAASSGFLEFAALDQDGKIIDTTKIVKYYQFPPYIFSNYISYIPGTANVDVRTYTLRADSPDYVLDGNGKQDDNISDWSYTNHPIHSITLTPDSSDLGINPSWTDPSDGNKFRTSLDNEGFTINIENIVIPSWGMDDGDFNSGDSYIGLYLISSPDAGAPVSSAVPIWKTQLSALPTQTFQIPADAAKYTGHYQVKAQLSSKGNRIDYSNAVDCYLDKMKLTEFGPKAAKHSFDYTTDSGIVKVSENYNYGFGTPYIYMGSQNGKKVTLSFGAEGGSISAGNVDYRQTFIKVWNASAETIADTAPGSARWYDISSGAYTKEYEISFFDTAGELKSAVLGDAAREGLGLIRNQENLVRYQIAGANGEASAVRTLLVEVSEELPVIEMELVPDYSAVNLQSATAFIKKLESATMTEMTAKTAEAIPNAVGSDGYLITDNKPHDFYTVNTYGNFGFCTITAPFADSEKPETSIFWFQGDMNYKNSLGITYTDNMPADPSQTKLFLKFEQAYMDRLRALSGFEVNSEGYMQVNLPKMDKAAAGSTYGDWIFAGEAAPGGIYKVGVTKNTDNGSGVKYNIWLYMDYLYDDTKPVNFDMPVSFYMEDQAGNRSDLKTGSIAVLNEKPKVIRTDMDPQLNNSYSDIDLVFNKPVRVTSPNYLTHTNHDGNSYAGRYQNPEKGFVFRREAFPIYGVGSYDVTMADIFGNEYKETYTPSIDFKGFGLDVEYSTTDLVKGKVSVTIKAQSEGTVFFGVDHPQNYEYSNMVFSGIETGMLRPYKKSATITVSDNGCIVLWLKKVDDVYANRTVVIPVTNILSHAPDAQETWYYSEFASNTLPQGVAETTHMVTVFINSAIPNRSIQGAEGSSLSYTFPYGTKAGDAYTFTYTDAVGNIGTKTVCCPVSIVRPLLPQEDKEAPNFTVKVYGRYGETYKEAESWYSPITSTPRDEEGKPLFPVTEPAVNAYTTFRELLENVSWTRGYKLVFEVFDSSPTKLVLLNPEDTTAGLTYANAAGYMKNIQGVSINGNIITVTDKDAEFKIAVVDDGNEHVLIGDTYESKPYSSVKEMNFGGTDNWFIDLIPPTAETALELKDFYTIMGFFRLSDTQSTPAVISPLWQIMADSGSPYYAKYKDWYYKEFTEDATINIDYRDTAYNMARTAMQVSGIDSSSPKAEVQWWTPSAYFVDALGNVTKYTNQAPNHKTNGNVCTGISFNKNITSMKLWLWNGTDYTDDSATVAPYATLDQQADYALISFLKDAKVKLTYAAQNKKTGEIELTLANVIDKETPVVTIVETKNDAADSTKAIFVFSISEDVTDLAGKKYKQSDGQFEKEITRRGTYEYIFTDDAGNTAKVTGTVSNIDGTPPVIVFNDMPDENTLVKDSYTFKAAMNEAGTITMQDQIVAIAAPTDFIDGKPDLEKITWHYFTVTQNGSYLVTGTDLAGNKSRYYVSINCIDNIPPNITMQRSTLKVRQGTNVGELTEQALLSGVIITDNVSSAADVTVRINDRPSQNDLDTVGVYAVTITAADKAGNSREAQRFIRVYPKDEPEVLVNGQKTDNDGTTVIIGTYDLKISVDIPDFAGEPYTIYMRKGDKTAGQMKRNATVVEGGTFTVNEDGYYTLYIVRQNREIYLTRLYIQK